MKISKKVMAGAVGVLTIIGGVGVASAAFAATPQTNGSDGALYLWDGTPSLQEGTSPVKSWGWNEEVYGVGSDTDVNGVTTCPAQSTGVFLFMSAPGAERTVPSWKAYSVNGFVPGTKDVQLANLSPYTLTAGNPGQAAIKASGGSFSYGIACTTSNGNTVVGAFYRSITVVGTAGGGAGTWSAAAVDAPVGPPVDPSQTGDITLDPSTLDATNGVLSLEVPVGAAATFNAPTLVNNKSTTTGTLGQFTVKDGRVVTRQGWTLSADLVDFVNTSNGTISIGKAQLGLVPQIVSSDEVGVTVGSTQIAGAATYASTFAEGAPANSAGNTVLNAALTFVAPQDKPAGTYHSTMTLTVVSK